MLFRRRAKQGQTPEALASAVAVQPPEEGVRELVLRIMRSPPDLRYRAARDLGLLDGVSIGGGREFERQLLERARDARQLAALEQASRP